jgi:fatty acid desaturase
MRIQDYLDRSEIQALTRRSDGAGLWMLAVTWGLVAAIFAVAARWPHPLVMLLAVLLLGGRQLGLAVMMHEAGHRSLFRSDSLNRICGQWLAAYPVLGDCEAYASSHREHHRLAGTAEDPDLPNYRSYPVGKASFRRKLWRDLSGQTGLRLLAGTLRGAGNRLMMRDGERGSAVGRGLLVNALLLAVLTAAGAPWLYLLWVAAYLTSYPLVARIRQVAEHGAVRDLYDPDPRLNTRTTIASWYERLLLCPNHVNYHLEHHLLAAVPAHRLGAMHRLLKERGFYDDYPDAIVHGYLNVIRHAVPDLRRRAPASA